MSEVVFYEPMKAADLRELQRSVPQGQWQMTPSFENQAFDLTLTPSWNSDGAALALTQAYAIVTPTWTLMVSDFDTLCGLLLGGSALHPDAQVRLRLLIALSLEIQRCLAVVQCEIMAVKDSTTFAAQWLAPNGARERKRGEYRFSGELSRQDEVLSGFMAIVNTQSDVSNILTPSFKKAYCVKRKNPQETQLSHHGHMVAESCPLTVPLTLGFIDYPLLSKSQKNTPLVTGALYAFTPTNIDDSGRWTHIMEDYKLEMNLNADVPDTLLTLEPSEVRMLSNLNDMPQVLEVSLGHLHLSYGELLAMKQGQAFKVAGLGFPKVKIFSLNQCVAQGELVTCDDQLFVQILDVFTGGEHDGL